MSKHSNKKTSKYDGLFGRVSNETTFEKNGKKRRIKTAVLLDKTMIEEANPDIDLDDFNDLLELKFQKNIRSIPTNCGVKEISEFNENMSPEKVKVKNCKKPLTRVAKIGALSLYSNYQELIPLEDQNLPEVINEKKFKKNHVVRNINNKTHRPTYKKHIKKIITKKSLKKVRKKIAKNGGKRHITQNRVMGGSATEYFRATRFDKHHPISQEWSHLVAHKFVGPKSQVSRNLGATSSHTNTQMMFVENQIPKIVNTTKRIKVKLNVKASVIRKTHIINDCIKYKVTIKKKSKKKKNNKKYVLSFLFHPQVKNKPHGSDAEYVHEYIKSTFSLFNKSKDEFKGLLASADTPAKYLTFYQK